MSPAEKRDLERRRLLPAAERISRGAVTLVNERYGPEPKRLEWIAGRLNTTREAVRQLEARIRHESRLPDHFTPAGVGRWIMSGYVVLYRPDHPLANDRGTVLEHRMVLHDAGIEIPPDYDVHHRNGDRSDNRLDNLELLPREAHQELHARQRRGT